MAAGASPRDTAAALDSTVFGGRAMTYYGRWTYKYEIASERGAAAALIVHETGPAGYPYEVVRGSFAAAVTSASSDRLRPGAMIPPLYAPR